MAYILGINACFTSNHHDPSVSLFRDGEPIFALEEERLTRIKTSAGLFPILSLQAALKYENIHLNEIKYIGMPGVKSPDLVEKTSRLLNHYFGYSPQVLLFDHEYCHAAAAHFSSGFKDSTAISIDGAGDGYSGVSLRIEGSSIKPIADISLDSSLGIFYGIFTEYLGFRRTEGEFKVMGMAAYGEPKYDLSAFFEDTFKLTGVLRGLSQFPKTTSLIEPFYDFNGLKKLVSQLPDRRVPGEPFKQEHFDLAASVQHFFERAYQGTIKASLKSSKSRNLCLSGGCALNCLANSFLIDNSDIDDFYVQPAASDRGLSLGAGYLACLEAGITPSPCLSMYLGVSYEEHQVKNVLDTAGVSYRKPADIYAATTSLLGDGSIVAWFQGRSEFGPRALGARSILADATRSGIKDQINSKIKFRESYRPFAPIVGTSLYSQLGIKKELLHMTVAAFPEKKLHHYFGETIHADGSTRVQYVNSRSEQSIYKLVSAHESSGGSALINTSFNLAGEPLVESPIDALRTFFSSGIDHLAIGPFLLSK